MPRQFHSRESESGEQQLSEEQEAAQAAMREQMNRIEASGEDNRAYTAK